MKRNRYTPMKTDNKRYRELFDATDATVRAWVGMFGKLSWINEDLEKMSNESTSRTLSLALDKIKSDIEKLQQEAKEKGLL